jgi:hypothetical protein
MLRSWESEDSLWFGGKMMAHFQNETPSDLVFPEIMSGKKWTLDYSMDKTKIIFIIGLSCACRAVENTFGIPSQRFYVRGLFKNLPHIFFSEYIYSEWLKFGDNINECFFT